MGLFSNGQEVREVTLGEIKLYCTICKNQHFWLKKVQLNTAMATFFNFDWANKSADCYICSHCGHIHWFWRKKK